jgi:hypothetical protein
VKAWKPSREGAGEELASATDGRREEFLNRTPEEAAEIERRVGWMRVMIKSTGKIDWKMLGGTQR